ncbi:MAG: oligosaccharide flippase family protein [Vampirovibrionales bacterium]
MTNTPNAFTHLTSRKTLLSSLLVNGVNKIIPMVLGVVTIPFFIKGIGQEQFGILTIIWSFIGYGMMLDLGLGSALTRHIAGCLSENNTQGLPSVIYSTVLVGFLFGCMGTGLFYMGANFLVDFLSISPSFHADALLSLRIMGFIVPLMVANLILVGVLEAFQEFKAINHTLWPIYISNFVLPIFLIPSFPTLSIVVWCVLLGRFVSLVMSIQKVKQLFPKQDSETLSFQLEEVKPLLGYSKWLSLYSVLSTLMGSFDKSIISNILGASNIAYYTTPNFGLSRISVFVQSAMKVVFPMFRMKQNHSEETALRMYFKLLGVMAVGLLILYGTVALLARPVMEMWINPEFAQNAYLPTVLICASFYFLNLTSLSSSFMQSTGKAKRDAVILAILFPFYIGALYLFVKPYGVVGGCLCVVGLKVVEFIIKNILILQHRHELQSIVTEGQVINHET